MTLEEMETSQHDTDVEVVMAVFCYSSKQQSPQHGCGGCNGMVLHSSEHGCGVCNSMVLQLL